VERNPLERLFRALLFLPFLILAASALSFAWQDLPGLGDVTQLRAISLPIGRLLGWIAGSIEPGLIPAPSRTAPLPLLIDWLLWRILPFGVQGLRAAHILIALAGFAVLIRALSRRTDRRVALLAGLLIALSPRVVVAIIGIGPNPFIFALFCCLLAILLTRGQLGGPVPLLMFTAIAAALGLCGIAGMLAAASLFAPFLLSAADRADGWRRAGALALVLPVWLPPLGEQILDGTPSEPLTLPGLAVFTSKLIAHNADLVLMPGGALMLGGMALLILIGLHGLAGRWSRNGGTERSHPAALLLIAATTGVMLALLGGPLLRLYLWLDPSAQIWLVLLAILLAAAAFTPRLITNTRTIRRARFIATLMALAGSATGSFTYHYHAGWFASGPERGLRRALAPAGSNRALIYTGFDWGRAYFTHAWSAPADNEQWLLALDGESVQRVLPGGRLLDPQPLESLNGYDALVIARVERRGWRDLGALRSGEIMGAVPPASLRGFPPGWRPDAPQPAPGEVWLTTQTLTKRTDF
jgi:hypothetical protein